MNCIFCGKQVPDDASYCMYCGRRIHREKTERLRTKHDKTNDRPRVTAILLAAGRGTRMGSSVRKQFMELAGRPVLSWSLSVLAKSPVISDIVLVIPDGTSEEIRKNRYFIEREFVDTLGSDSSRVASIVPGGSERYNSVYNGIEAITWPCDYVFIHDGARPLITEKTLETLLAAVIQYKAVVAACPSKDTVKITDDSGFVSSTPDRSHVWNIQTPQCFEYELIKNSYEKVVGAEKESDATASLCRQDEALRKITDDAMIVEYASDIKIRPIDTGCQNIKITTPEDLMIAETLMRNRT